MLEAQGEQTKALGKYESMLEASDSNWLAHKRKVALLKSQNLIKPTINALLAYIMANQADVEAWKELACIYLSQSAFSYALFCFEEVILSEPASYISHLLYAETLYTLGKDFKLARQYFAQSLVLKKEANGRALVGLTLAAAAFSEKMRDTNEELMEEQEEMLSHNKELQRKCIKDLRGLYTDKAPKVTSMLMNRVLDKLML